jgi:hypothetical protein
MQEPTFDSAEELSRRYPQMRGMTEREVVEFCIRVVRRHLQLLPA